MKILAVVLIVLAAAVVCSLTGCSRKRDTLLVFTSPSCRQCQLDKPMVASIGRSGKVRIMTVIAEHYPGMMDTYNVTALPTYILVRDGKVLWREPYAINAKRRIARGH